MKVDSPIHLDDEYEPEEEPKEEIKPEEEEMNEDTPIQEEILGSSGYGKDNLLIMSSPEEDIRKMKIE